MKKLLENNRKIFIMTVLICSIFFVNTLALAKKGEVTETDTEKIVKIISENKGKVVVLNIFATWCRICMEQTPDLVKFYSELPLDKVVMLGISLDSNIEPVKSYINKYKIGYGVYLADSLFPVLFNINAVPQLLVYDVEGQLLERGVGLVSLSDYKKLILENIKK